MADLLGADGDDTLGIGIVATDGRLDADLLVSGNARRSVADHGGVAVRPLAPEGSLLLNEARGEPVLGPETWLATAWLIRRAVSAAASLRVRAVGMMISVQGIRWSVPPM